VKEQQYTVSVGGIDVEVTKKQMKSLRLCVHPDGRVTLSAPYLVTKSEIERFVDSKLDWIKPRLAAAHKENEENVVFGERTDQTLTDVQKRAILHGYITERMPYFESLTGLKCEGFIIRDMSTRWGSCTPSARKIRFAKKLVTRKKDEIDYVILHELIHIRVPNHGDAFKREMGRYMPDWRERQKTMK